MRELQGDMVRRSGGGRAPRARRRGAVAAVVGVALAAAGCGASGTEVDAPERSGTVAVYAVVDGKLVVVEHEVGGADQMRPQGRALAAVEALVLDKAERPEGAITQWGGRCSSGAKVDQVEVEAARVVVRVRGAAGVMCQRTGKALEQQRQQLAWTAVDNLEVDPATPVRLYGPNGGVMWEDVVADEGLLAR